MARGTGEKKGNQSSWFTHASSSPSAHSSIHAAIPVLLRRLYSFPGLCSILFRHSLPKLLSLTGECQGRERGGEESMEEEEWEKNEKWIEATKRLFARFPFCSILRHVTQWRQRRQGCRWPRYLVTSACLPYHQVPRRSVGRAYPQALCGSASSPCRPARRGPSSR